MRDGVEAELATYESTRTQTYAIAGCLNEYSPGRVTRVMRAAERRANTILAPWGLQVASHNIALALSYSCRPGRVARRAALWTLRHAFGPAGHNDIAEYHGTSRGYRRLVAAAGSVKAVRRIFEGYPPGELDTPRNRLAYGLAAVRRLQYARPGTSLIALAVTRTVACSNNTAWLMSTRRHGEDHPYTTLPRWYFRRREYIVRADVDGTRTPLLQGSRTRVGICTAWKTHMLDVWFVEAPRGRTYHAFAYDADTAVRIAKRSWRTRRQSDRSDRRNARRLHSRERFLERYLQEGDRTILVRISDSLEAGNCRFGTEQWRDSYFAGRSAVPLQALLPHQENHAVSRVVSTVLEREMTQAE